MKIDLYPMGCLKRLLYIILFLLFANTMGIIANFFFSYDFLFGLIPLFDFSTENNFPTLYSSITLLIASFILSLIASTHKKHNASYIPWVGLSFIFLFLGFDEIFSIHEKFEEPVRDFFNTSGLLYNAWVIPYGFALLVFVAVYLKFLTRLPNKIAKLFLLSGAIFVAGAIGFELFEGRHAELFGSKSLLYAFYYTCEEVLEMLGVALFIYTLLTYIMIQFTSLTIVISEKYYGDKP